MSTVAIRPAPPVTRIRLWLDTYLIVDYVCADPDSAERYRIFVAKEFGGLRLTSELLPAATEMVGPLPLPPERLWSLSAQ